MGLILKPVYEGEVNYPLATIDGEPLLFCTGEVRGRRKQVVIYRGEPWQLLRVERGGSDNRYPRLTLSGAIDLKPGDLVIFRNVPREDGTISYEFTKVRDVRKLDPQLYGKLKRAFPFLRGY